MKENLEKIEKFFSLDLKIKNQIISLKREDSYQLGDEYLEKYIKEISSILNDIENSFYNIINDFRFEIEIFELIKNKFNLYKERLYNSGYDFYKLKRFYEKNIYDLSPNIVAQTKNEIFGYSIDKNIYPLLSKSTTINEMLHILHYYIINNEEIYQSMPKIYSKINGNNEDINLYGNLSDLSYNLFANFPTNIDVGITDIISLKDKVLMMIRDIGHATVFEIEEKDGKIWVQYYIPKICNIDMVNNLKGVKKVTSEDRCTSGLFVTDRSHFLNDIYLTISKIPGDDDMVFDTGKRR